MFMMICTLDDTTKKVELESILNKNNGTKSLTWLLGYDGLSKIPNTNPVVGGSLSSLFSSKERKVAIATIKGQDNLSKIKKLLYSIKTNKSLCDYIIIPIER